MIAALLLDPFALWSAERAHGKVPLATARGGRVVHANGPARQGGVVPGMRVVGALSRLPDLEVVSEAAPAHGAAWGRICAELPALSPRVEVLGLGRALLTLREADAALLAAAYGARMGLAASREVALLAAFSAGAGEARVVGADEESDFLRALPLAALMGVGLSERSARRLAWLGVRTVGSLLQWSRGQLAAFLGAEWTVLRPFLFGPRCVNVAPARVEADVRAGLDLDVSAHEPWETAGVLAWLARRAGAALGERAARRVVLRAVTVSGAFEAVREAKQGLRDADAIARLGEHALHDLGKAPYEVGIDRLELHLSGLHRRARQGDLWGHVQAREATELVARRYPQALRRVKWLDPHSLAPDHAFCWIDALSGEEVGVRTASLAALPAQPVAASG